MNSTQTKHPLRMMMPLAAFTLASPLSAVELTDLAGDWTLADFTTPSRLRENFYNTVTEASRLGANSSDFAKANEILVDAFYPDPLSTETRTFAMSPSGTITGGESGQILSISSNRLVYSDSTETTTLYSSVNGDVLITSAKDIDSQYQTVCLKRPADFVNSDLEGTWAVISMFNPRDISKNQQDGRLADVYFTGDSRFDSGVITFNTTGGFSGTFQGSATGNSIGDLAVVPTGEGVIPFKINASKNIMAATPGDSDEQEYTLLVKKPDTLVTADLAGTWRISSLQIPTSLTENFYNVVTEQPRAADSSGVALENEILVDIYHRHRPELVRLQVMFDAAGTISGSTIGTIAANGDKSVTALIDGGSVTFHPNADKTFMMAAKNSADFHEFIIAVKIAELAPENFEEMVDLTLIQTPGKLILNWNSASNLMLEESTALGGWEEVIEAAGSDSFVADTTGGGAKFFRVSERSSAD